RRDPAGKPSNRESPGSPRHPRKASPPRVAGARPWRSARRRSPRWSGTGWPAQKTSRRGTPGGRPVGAPPYSPPAGGASSLIGDDHTPRMAKGGRHAGRGLSTDQRVGSSGRTATGGTGGAGRPAKEQKRA